MIKAVEETIPLILRAEYNNVKKWCPELKVIKYFTK